MKSPIKIVLLTMVKNEEKNISRLFSSVKPWIDGIVLCDTGSTDATVQVAKGLIEDSNLPGRIYQYSWENFGKSRSKSFQCFRDWVSRHTQWRPDQVFALLLDADMTLNSGDGLRERLEAMTGDQGGASLQQQGGNLIYSNTRLIRASDSWKCTGSTHEYWECHGRSVVNFDSPVIVDIGDGGSKADKFTRDAQLLENDLKDDPTNVRTHFYLGQTYMSLGEQEKAIASLKTRIELGGWDEEIYIAHLYIGDCLKTLGRVNEAIEQWLKAWQFRIHRTEAAMRLIIHYRSIPNMFHIAYMYIEKLVQLQLGETLEGHRLWKPVKNNDVLFITHTDMKYTVWEELGVVGFYAGRKEATQTRLDSVSLSNSLDFHQRNRIHDLYQWYKWHIPLTQKVRMRVPEGDLPWLKEGCWESFNPSIRREGDRYVVNLRTANYQTSNAWDYTYRGYDGLILTRNVIVDMNNKFEILYDKKATTEFSIPEQYVINKETRIHGVEDCRWLGTTSFIGTTQQFGTNNTNRMIRVDIDGASRSIIRLKVLTAPIATEDGDCQKNWLPFIRGGQELFIYKINPFLICTIKNEKVVEWKPPPHISFDGLRGSAPPVPWKSTVQEKEAWLLVVHFCHYGPGGKGRMYYHRFITLGDDLVPSRISKVVVFGDEAIQYVSGMCESLIPGRYIITMGVNDSQAWALETESSTIEASLIYAL